MKNLKFMSNHDAQSDRLNTTSLKNAIVFRMILNSFFHTTDTNHKDRKSCYKKYRVHRSSANIGITICTIVTVTKIYTTVPCCLRSILEMEHNMFPIDHIKLLFMNQQNIRQTAIFVTKSFVK
jgi:hypothetical protein